MFAWALPVSVVFEQRVGSQRLTQVLLVQHSTEEQQALLGTVRMAFLF